MIRLLLIVVVVAGLAAGIADGLRPPPARASTAIAVGAIHLYQATLSRVYARTGVQCRFTPSCSHYAEACVREFGVTYGGWLALKRVMRCGPWTPAGTNDPPPVPAHAAALLHGR